MNQSVNVLPKEETVSLDSSRMLDLISRRIKQWNLVKTFKHPLIANVYARNLMDTKIVHGVRVAHLIGGDFAIFSWIKDAK